MLQGKRYKYLCILLGIHKGDQNHSNNYTMNKTKQWTKFQTKQNKNKKKITFV